MRMTSGSSGSLGSGSGVSGSSCSGSSGSGSGVGSGVSGPGLINPPSTRLLYFSSGISLQKPFEQIRQQRGYVQRGLQRCKRPQWLRVMRSSIVLRSSLGILGRRLSSHIGTARRFLLGVQSCHGLVRVFGFVTTGWALIVSRRFLIRFVPIPRLRLSCVVFLFRLCLSLTRRFLLTLRWPVARLF